MAAETRTETALDGGGPSPPARAAYLFVVLDGGAPLSGGLRIRLDGVQEISIGRGEHRAVTELGDGRTLDLRLPDRRISTRHARLRRGLAGWELEDTASKNGTRVDGELATRASLDDGTLILVGHTVLRLRDELDHDGGAAVADDPAPLAGIATLLPGLAARLGELVRLAPSQVPLVLGGETGTGKEVVARAVHELSGRRGDFVAVNCAALPAGLVEGELFGHRRGAFTGAVDDKLGLIRAAHGGTLLLDELGDLAAPAQAALLRVLQEREVLPIGDSKPAPVDVRFIAASHHDLDALVGRGVLRADLHARLAGHTTVLPPLRERREDLGVLVAALLRRHAGGRAGTVELTPEAAYRLAASPWPGNVRGLEKALETALALAGETPIGAEHLRSVATASPAPGPDDDALRARLTALLTEHRGNISHVARAMGKARMQVQRWLKRFELDAERFRG